MALVDTTWYTNFGNGTSTGYYAVALRPNNGAVAAGAIRRQFTAPAVGSERCFVCIIAGTTAAVTDATWVLTRGAKTTDNTVTWMECTGQAALNGDLTNTATWAQVKAATPAVLGQIIKRSNNASYQICTTAGAMSASEPAFSDTAGVTTTDTTAVWTSLGLVSNFTGGQAPHARLNNVFGTSWFAAGNTVYVGANHAETQATILQIQPTGHASFVGKILCHNQAGSYPPAAGDLTTGATISTTGAVNMTFTPSSGGTFYIYGLTFRLAIGQTTNQNITLTSNSSWLYWDRCSFEVATTNSVASINVVGSGSGSCTFNNSTVKLANVAQVLNISGQFLWQNTGPVLVSGSLVPTSLLSSGSNAFTSMVLEALDFSQLTGSLFTALGAAQQCQILVKDCKLNAATTVTTPTGYGTTIQLVRCDSGATGYKSTRYNFDGTETTETTITRVGGSVDPTGQAQSRKIVTTANAQWLRPFRAEPYAVWNPRTGANVTVTVCGTINAGALPNNDDIWLEVEYLGSATDPLGSIVTTTKSSLLASNAAVSSDGSTWNGGGSGAGWSPFKLAITLSAPQLQLAGYLHARVRAAKASTTYYIDPQVVLS